MRYDYIDILFRFMKRFVRLTEFQSNRFDRSNKKKKENKNEIEWHDNRIKPNQ